jgi:Na+-driven multidrug efflux pump
MNEQNENIMGTMPEGRLLFKLSLPMIMSVLVSSLYSIVDSIFVGMLGQDALTAISLGTPACTLMVELSFGVAVGVNAILPRRLGENDPVGVSRTAGQGACDDACR